MEIIEHKQNEAETPPECQRCPRHGSRVSRYHRCPRCVIEEVRRAERRLGALCQCEEPIRAGSTYQAF